MRKRPVRLQQAIGSFALLAALLAALLWAAPATGQQDSGQLPDVEELRRQLDRLESERRARAQQDPVATPDGATPDADQLRNQLNRMETERREVEANRPFGWEENFRPFELKLDPSKDRENGIVELRYEAREVPCFVVFEPAGGVEAEPVQAPMVVSGSQWVRMPEGTWNVRLFVGYATGPVVEFASSPVEIEAGKVYRLLFGAEEEIAARDLIRDAARERREKRAERSVRAFP